MAYASGPPPEAPGPMAADATGDTAVDAAHAPGLSGPGAAGADAGRPPGRGRTLLRGASWQLLAQLAPLVVNLALTPYVIRTMGPVAYGYFIVASTLTAFLAQFDGGISRSANRYFALYAGARDRVATTRLLATLLLCIAALTSLTLGAVFLAASRVADFFHTPASLHDDTVFLLRVLTVTVGVALGRNLFAAILNANHRFALTSGTILAGYVVYAAGTVFVLDRGMGLFGMGLVFIVQQALATVTIIPTCFPYLTNRDVGLLSVAEIKDFFVFAWKVQLASLLNLVGLQGATLIVGRLAPADVPVFGPGSTFAQQLRYVPVNAQMPIQTMLGASVGSRGAGATVELFTRIQRTWVLAVCGWVSVGAPAAYFGVNVWLPLPGQTAGQVAGLMLIANLFILIPEPLITWAMLMKRPEYEMRNGIITVVLMLGLSVVLVPAVGALGVAAATIVAQAGSCAYMVSAARRMPTPVPSPMREVPWLRMLLCAALSFALVWGMATLIHAGYLPARGPGLLLCGLAAAPAMVLYVATTIGLRPALAWLRTRGRR